MFCSALDACLAPPGKASPAQQPANPLRQPSILKPTVAGHSDIDYFPEVFVLPTMLSKSVLLIQLIAI